MTQRIIEWPKALRLGAQEWELLMPIVTSTSAFSGATFDTLIGPPRWAFSMDMTNAPAVMLPQIEATLRQLRNGLNLLRIGDERRTGKSSVVPGGGRKAQQLIAWSGAWARWGRVGPEPDAIASGEAALHQATNYCQSSAEVVQAGLPYVAVVEISAPQSAQVSLSMAGDAVAAPLGVIFDAKTGTVVSQYGGVTGAGAVLADGRWRCWMTFAVAKTTMTMVQVYALLPAHGLHRLTLRRPVLATHSGQMPPAYVSASAAGVWVEMGVQVDGGAQAGDMLATRGWPPGAALKAGHWINYGDGMHQLLAAVTPDADGKALLWIEPPIRRSPADGKAVTVRNVTGLFKLKAGPKIRQEGLLVPGQTLTFEEYLQ